MNLIEKYIINMMPYIFISIPIVLLVRYIVYRKTNKINIYHETILIIFSLFLIGLLSQTILPLNNGKNYINFIPFKIFYDSYIELLDGNIYYLLISFLGNIIIFIPIGFLLSVLYNFSDKKIILIGFMISLFIEIYQLFLPRETDIDDLILNTLGTFIGLLLYKYINKKKKNIFDKFKNKSSY